MKSKLICFLFVLFILIPVSLAATPVVVAATWDIEYPRREEADGINLTGIIQSKDNQIPKLEDSLGNDSEGNTWALVEFNLTQDKKNPVNWKFVAEYKAKKIVNIPDRVRIGLSVIVMDCNIILIEDVIWMKRRPIPEPDPDPFLSFDIHRVYGNLLTTIINANEKVDMMVDNLEFAVSNVQIPLFEMGNTQLGMGVYKASRFDEKLKWVPYKRTLYLAPGESYKIYMKDLGINLEPGQFLLLRSTDPKNNLFNWGQHEEP
jgi:hypothetical protein